MPQVGLGHAEQAGFLVVGPRPVQDVVAFPVALRRHVIDVAEDLRQVLAQDLSTSFADQTKNLPSSPSLSASCVL